MNSPSLICAEDPDDLVALPAALLHPPEFDLVGTRWQRMRAWAVTVVERFVHVQRRQRAAAEKIRALRVRAEETEQRLRVIEPALMHLASQTARIADELAAFKAKQVDTNRQHDERLTLFISNTDMSLKITKEVAHRRAMGMGDAMQEGFERVDTLFDVHRKAVLEVASLFEDFADHKAGCDACRECTFRIDHCIQRVAARLPTA